MKEGKEADLLERIAGDDAFGLDREELESLMEPGRFVGRAPEQVDRFLEDRVAPVLKRHGEAARQRLQAPELRV